ncbi:MAG TPA: exopolysaccharide biosynthesis polyprenyl glycosylphosphotransferase [Solirubrobacteraceae bacterium]|jgi:exopolysaccharide biosynthesis polyprenyl glycosylphosphotransferase|nr:exopolysaccharide biosynthesis polyprenyl glycosylphosphotransferase [Solirubrobacteraceae bacterium]
MPEITSTLPLAVEATATPALETTATPTGRLRGQARVKAVRQALRATDIVGAAVALAVVLATARGGHVNLYLVLVAMPLTAVICGLVGLNRIDEVSLGRSTVDDLPKLAEVAILFVFTIAVTDSLAAGRTLEGGRWLFLWAATFVALTIGRMMVRGVTKRVLDVERCIVIGDAAVSNLAWQRIEESGSRLSVVGAIALTQDDIAEIVATSAIAELLEQLDGDRIIISSALGEAATDLIRVAKASGASVSILPGIFDLVGSSIGIDDVNGVRLVGVETYGIPRGARLLKRGFDLAVTAAGVTLALPLFALIALAIKLDSSGSVFFLQTRVGRNGKHFRMIKFRSMVDDAEARKESLRNTANDGQGLFKMRQDPRVTRVGRFLRRSSLDELPQLLNVLHGHMSLVGPRPLIEDEDALILGLDRTRLDMPPGITGPWQVLRTRASRQEMVEIDYRYAANWTLWLDLRIMMRTASHVARRGNL